MNLQRDCKFSNIRNTMWKNCIFHERNLCVFDNFLVSCRPNTNKKTSKEIIDPMQDLVSRSCFEHNIYVKNVV